LGGYFTGLVVAALLDGLWGAVPFLALFAGGFLYTALLGLGNTPLFSDKAVSGELCQKKGSVP
jgi:hypothetical protein